MKVICEILAQSSEPAFFARDGVLLYANSGARRLLGELCVGKKIEELFGQELCSNMAHAAVIQQRLAGEEYLLRVGKIQDGQIVFLDRIEEEPVLLNEAFLASLRNNLMLLSASADTVRPFVEEHGDAGMAQIFPRLTASIFRLMRMEQNISLARQLFEKEVAIAPCAAALDLSLLMNATIDAVEEHLPALQIERDIPDGLQLVADARQIQQLVYNLISNAVLHGQADRVRIAVKATHTHMLLRFSDNGVGIPEAEIATVFSRYTLAVPPLKPQSGIGLGLSAARSITMQHHGALLLESRAGEGTLVQASFARNLSFGHMSACDPTADMRGLLLGLSEILPAEAFSERFLE